MLTVGCTPAAHVAKKLDEAKVPNVLWGWWALSVVGTPQPCREVDFVVADTEVERAIDTLVAGGYKLCTDTACKERHYDALHNGPSDSVSLKHRYHPVANVHFHLQDQYQYFTTLRIYAKGRILWWLSDPNIGLPGKDDPLLMISTDASLPEENSRLWKYLYPVRILNVNTLIEAVMCLLCRDFEHPALAKHWYMMLGELVEPYERYGQTSGRALSPIFQQAWNLFRDPTPNVGIMAPFKRLREELNQEFPLPLPHWI